MGNFNQLCVWPATMLGDSSVEDFEKFFAEQGYKIKFAEEVVTLPDKDNSGNPIPETGGRHDIFFYIDDEDIPKFAIPRLQMGIRWWEDVLGNGGGDIYSEEILEKYPKTW